MPPAYDLALWAMSLYVYKTVFTLAMREDNCPASEHFFLIMLTHTIFMTLAQAGTTLPASGGLPECLEANPNGVEAWPWYGMSFLTQAGAGGRACADMIYSGHMANVVVLSFVGAEYYHLVYTDTTFWHWVTCIVLGLSCAVFLVLCQDHYTVDIVLAVGIATLLSTNAPLKELGTRWSDFNYSLECRFTGAHTAKAAVKESKAGKRE